MGRLILLFFFTFLTRAGPMATEASDNNNAGPVTSGVIATRSKHPFATRPYAFGRPSNMGNVKEI